MEKYWKRFLIVDNQDSTNLFYQEYQACDKKSQNGGLEFIYDFLLGIFPNK